MQQRRATDCRPYCMSAHEPSRIQWARSRDASPTIFHSYAYCVLSDIAQTFHAMIAHIHTLKVVIKMLSRYKGSFSADRQQTDNEKDPAICQLICHNANDPDLYSLGPSLKSRPLHRVS
jgi:hypothetical protein